jgi:hypothetical protein
MNIVSDGSSDFCLVKVLILTNSCFERFSACIPRNFGHLKGLLAYNCRISELGDTLMRDALKKSTKKICCVSRVCANLPHIGNRENALNLFDYKTQVSTFLSRNLYGRHT